MVFNYFSLSFPFFSFLFLFFIYFFGFFYSRSFLFIPFFILILNNRFGREMFLETQKLTLINEMPVEGEEEKPIITLLKEEAKWDQMKMITVDFADPSLLSLSFEDRFKIILSSLHPHLPSLISKITILFFSFFYYSNHLFFSFSYYSH